MMVICKYCALEDQLEQFDLEIEDLVDDMEDLPTLKLVGFGEKEELICIKCEEVLEPRDMYFIDEDDINEYKELIAKKIGKILSNQIEYCSHCKGAELEQYKYVALKEDINLNIGGIDVWDFMNENNVLEEYYGLVIDNLVCSNCNYGKDDYHPKHNPMGGHFDLDDCFYTETEIDDFWGVNEQRVSDLASQYGIAFNNSEINEFIEYLYEKPMIAFKSTTAEKLYSLLKKVYEAQDYEIMRIGKKCYRGRSRGKDGSKFAVKDLSYPPSGIASHGRFNAIGISVLYCTNNINGIPYEIEPKKNQVVDVVELMCQKELMLFNIDSVFKGFSEYTSKENIESKMLKKNYLFTNFISDSCSELGYDGITYSSVGTLSHQNMAFFKDSTRFLAADQEIMTIDYNIHYSK